MGVHFSNWVEPGTRSRDTFRTGGGGATTIKVATMILIAPILQIPEFSLRAISPMDSLGVSVIVFAMDRFGLAPRIRLHA